MDAMYLFSSFLPVPKPFSNCCEFCVNHVCIVHARSVKNKKRGGGEREREGKNKEEEREMRRRTSAAFFFTISSAASQVLVKTVELKPGQ